MDRVYQTMLTEHLASFRQMAFVAGPRQVGKTTTCRGVGSVYLDWDARDHMRVLISGPDAVAKFARLHELGDGDKPVLVFDELHKYPHWKRFLKGFFDVYEDRCRVVVTGSSRLDVYRRGGDSLMGRYFLFRMHPFSVAELMHSDLPQDGCLRPPVPIDEDAWDALWRHGGFPEPMIQSNDRFTLRWRGLRHTQVFKEDARDLTRIQDVALLEVMGTLLEDRSGQQLSVANLARDVGVAPNTAKAWLVALCALHVGFLIKPWYRNVSRSLRKEPKWFLRDWAGIQDPGQRFETFVACHLLKAVEGWTDLGLSRFALHYLRDKQKREVDFLIVKDDVPWFLVECKVSDCGLSPALTHFQQATQAPHAFQVVLEREYIDADCFSCTTPTVVSARTFLSQLF